MTTAPRSFNLLILSDFPLQAARTSKNVLCLLSVLISLLFTSCRRYETCVPTVRNITESVYAPGTVKTRNQYEVYSNVAGTVQTLFVKAGDTVIQHAPLILIKDDIPKLNYANAAASAEYADLRRNENRLAQLEIKVRDNRERLVHDSLLYSRQLSLWKQGIGTRNELDQRRLAYTTAVDNLRVSQLEYLEAQRELKYSASQSNTNKLISRSQMDEHTIRAITNGIIYKVYVDPGEYVTVTKPIAVVGDRDDFYVELEVDELDVGRVQAGQTVEFQFDSDKERVYEGKVESIDPFMNTGTRSFTVRCSLLNRPEKLYPNNSADANIVVRQRQDALVIPVSYVRRDSTVLLRSGESRKVVIGAMNFEFAEVLEGVSANDVLRLPEQ